MNDDYYDTQQVCEQGHKITDYYDSQPNTRKDFCEICGSKTIISCPKCGEKIRGYRHISGVFDFAEIKIPRHCFSCGNLYPWAEVVANTNSTNTGLEEEIKMDLYGRKVLLKKCFVVIASDKKGDGERHESRYKNAIENSIKQAGYEPIRNVDDTGPNWFHEL